MSTLKKIDIASIPALDSSLSIFDLPPSNVAFNKSYYRELLPLTTISNNGPFIYRIFADNQWLDLSKTWFALATSIEKNVNGDWVDIDASETDIHVGVINNFGNSFIKQLKITINHTEASDSGTNYAYRSFLNHELSHSNEYKLALSEAALYYPEGINPDRYDNKAVAARCQRFEDGRICYTWAKLDFDLAHQNNLMLSNTDILFTIYRNDDSFLLHTPNYYKTIPPTEEAITAAIATGRRRADIIREDAIQTLVFTEGTNYRLKIRDIRLYIKTVDVTQSLNNAISRHLEISPAKYSMKKVEVRNLFIGGGLTHLTHNIFQTTVPRRIICCFVSSERYAGDKRLSPFYFEHMDIQSISVEAFGQNFPSVPTNYNFEQGDYVRAFVDLYTGLGMDEGDRTISINMAKFVDGWTFFVIPMQSTLEDSGGFELIRNSTTTIKVVFRQPVKNIGIQLIVFAEFDSILTINSDRVLSTDGSV